MSSADCSKGNVPPAWLCVMERERKNETYAAVNILYRIVPTYVRSVSSVSFVKDSNANAIFVSVVEQ